MDKVNNTYRPVLRPVLNEPLYFTVAVPESGRLLANEFTLEIADALINIILNCCSLLIEEHHYATVV